MNNRVIVFDLDETLRKLEFDASCEKIVKVVLRPGINDLLAKLKEVKEAGTDVIIWTTATTESAKKYFIDCLPQEYRDIFTDIISRDNKIETKSGSIEQKVYGDRNKPVTALEGYNQILLFDDNSVEADYLEKLYKDENERPDKQVIFARYPYNPPKLSELYAYKKLSEENKEIAKKTDKYFSELLKEPGCQRMIKLIEEFQQREFKPELIMYNRYRNMDDEQIKEFKSSTSDIEDEIEEYMYDNNLRNNYMKYFQEYYINLDKGLDAPFDDAR